MILKKIYEQHQSALKQQKKKKRISIPRIAKKTDRKREERSGDREKTNIWDSKR